MKVMNKLISFLLLKPKYIILLIINFLILIGGAYFLFDSTRPLYYGAATDHFDGKRFHNYDPTRGVFSLSDILKWQYYEFKDDIQKLWPKYLDDVTEAVVEERVYGDKIKITFVNHATFLIQTNGKNYITDPLFSDRASPFKWAGPKRYRKPGIAINNLPPIDYIILSHDHYDHCDIDSLYYIQQKFGSKILSGLGMSKFLSISGISSQDIDWWQEIKDGDVEISFVPAIHWSGRYGLLGNNRTLWGGFIINSPQGQIYFSGDTAFSHDVFQKISNRFNNIKIALIPIGAYEPRWFMKNHHINPEEAVKIHKIINSKISIAAHFGSFALSAEGEGHPEEDLLSAARKHIVRRDEFLILKNGEIYNYRN
jgi:L-ascorbate metabolism protein UlaG (beta-lactamase superfamily)